MYANSFIAGAAVALLSSASFAAPATSAGGVLADAEGMTLYVFDKDTNGESACYGGCAASWPPFIARSGAAPEGDFTLVTRKDGARQWAFKGQPLYYWQGDRQPGDTNGDGVGGTWHVVN